MINAGDTAWVLASSALVLFMTPGLALFYGGMVRRKNFLSVLMQCFILMCVVTLQWVLIGYSLSFGPDVGGGFIGDLSWAGLRGVGMVPSEHYATTVPHLAFMIFQCMFAVITPGLIIGAFAERIKFSGYLVLMLLWSTLVYDPVCHWVWSADGWLAHLHLMDFAGGTVVHINAGVAALVMALLIGKRVGYKNQPFTPHNLPLVVVGTGILWFGWFGFNAGSALAANGLAANAFVTTNVAGAAAGLAWTLIEWRHNGAPTMLGAATGAIAGLAAVTPACGFVGPMAAIVIGVMASVLGFLAVAYLKPRLGYDDSLDVFGVHGIGGMWGTLATGIFAQAAIGGTDGLLFGNPRQLLIQLAGVAATVVYSGVLTFVLYKAVDALIGMRVQEDSEVMGLDISQHREAGYTVLE
ncbi:MAG TPA: ammonium transporter [bacterium]|nr:ammonium transporter [bacterium]